VGRKRRSFKIALIPDLKYNVFSHAIAAVQFLAKGTLAVNSLSINKHCPEILKFPILTFQDQILLKAGHP
jgi:hypothetical protein